MRFNLLVLLALAACTGDIVLPRPAPFDPSNPNPVDPTDPTKPPDPPAPAVAAGGGLRRLTRTELDLTLSQLVGDPTHAALTLMPGEELTPYDNDYAKQQASAVWV